MSDSAKKFFVLDENRNDFPPELDFWAVIVPEMDPTSEDMQWLNYPDHPSPREQLIFSNGFKPFDSLDYVMNDCDWPILSKHALQILLNVFPEAHLEIFPVTLINGVYQGPGDLRFEDMTTEKFVSLSLARPELYNNEYVAVRVPILKDQFDWDLSIYSMLPDGKTPALVEKYVLYQPDRLPPLFRLQEKRAYLFCTAELREAWKAAGIYGPAFTSSEKTYMPAEVDVIVPLARKLIN